MRIFRLAIVVATLLLPMTLAASAQHEDHVQAPEKGAVQAHVPAESMGMGMMMGHMMSRPVHRTILAALVLPYMPEELGLTADLSERAALTAENLTRLGENLPATSSLGTHPTPEELSDLLKTRAEALSAAYARADRLMGELSDDQRARLKAMDPEVMHQALMQVPGHMDVMRLIASAGCPMMEQMHGRGMMHGEGMMKRDGMMDHGETMHGGKTDSARQGHNHNR